MTAADFHTAYAPDRIGRPWGYRSDDYATGAHRGAIASTATIRTCDAVDINTFLEG